MAAPVALTKAAHSFAVRDSELGLTMLVEQASTASARTVARAPERCASAILVRQDCIPAIYDIFPASEHCQEAWARSSTTPFIAESLLMSYCGIPGKSVLSFMIMAVKSFTRSVHPC